MERLDSVKTNIFRVKIEGQCNRELLYSDIEEYVQSIGEGVTLEDFYKSPEVYGAREAYRSLGIDPTRYRISVDSLYRRIIKGKGLYRVNPIVDLCNLISLDTKLSVGVYNAEAIQGNIYMRVGSEEDNYEGIGRGKINVTNMPLLCDDKGPFGSATSDSTRTMVKEDKGEIVINLFSFSDDNTDFKGYLSDIFGKYFGEVSVQ